MKKLYWILIPILIIVLIIGFIILTFGRPVIYSSRAHVEEFNQLNKCQTDIDCVVGQEYVGTDLPSPPPQCVTKAVIDRFDNWFESKVSKYSCFCDINSNLCTSK